MKNHLCRLSLTISVVAILGFSIAPDRESHGGRFGDREGAFDQITLLSPSGGEKFNAESTQRISWQSTRKVEYVKIEYSVNDGKDWIEIEKSLRLDSPADYYRWQVPCTLTDNAKVRLTQAYGWYDDVSLEPFSIVDSTPPAIELALKKELIWPPNGEMVDVGFSYSVSDNCDSNPVVFIRVTSDESPTGGPDSGTKPDAQILDGNRVLLKAQRSDAGDGRVYVITLTATDASNNSVSAHVTAKVHLTPGKRRLTRAKTTMPPQFPDSLRTSRSA